MTMSLVACVILCQLLLARRASSLSSMAMTATGKMELASASLRAASGSGLSVSFALTRHTRKSRSNSSIANRMGSSKVVYFGNVLVGSNQQSFQVVFDTGSGNLIIPGTECKSAACTSHKRFELAKSSTLREQNCDGAPIRKGRPHDELQVRFGTGQVTGKCYRDVICFHSICTEGSFVIAREESSQPFGDFKFDGVLGLGLPNLGQGAAYSILEALRAKGALAKPLFSVFLSNSDEEQSEVVFGDVATRHMASELFWVPVQGNIGYWEVAIQDITIDNNRTRICENCRAAVDTGTSLLAGPPHVMEVLRRKTVVHSDCSNYDKLPQVGFIVGGNVLNLGPNEYVSRQESVCSLAFMDLDIPPPNGPIFVLGIPFLQKFLTVYDFDEKRVGFAVAKHARNASGASATLGSDGSVSKATFLSMSPSRRLRKQE